MEKKIKKDSSKEKEEFPLATNYPAKDDIYNREEKESLEEDLKNKKKPADKSLDDGLDIPGAELDDADEAIGEEDEENNYYSLGGDNHEDLEEDKA